VVDFTSRVIEEEPFEKALDGDSERDNRVNDHNIRMKVKREAHDNTVDDQHSFMQESSL